MAYYTLPSNVSNYASGIPAPCIQACSDLCSCKLKVEGAGKILVQPDTAVVIMGVVTENKQLNLAQQENSERMTAVLKTLKTMGIPSEDIQTYSYNITPQYDYIDGRQVFRGYRVEHILQISIRDMEKIGEIVDAAVLSGVNQVNSITFSVANPSLYYQQALNAAVSDALAKARTLGIKLNADVNQLPVQIIELGEAGGQIPVPYQTTIAATPVQTGRIEITSRIEAVFAYRPRYG